MTSHFIFYERIHHPGSGFKFECDADGYINEAALTTALRNQLALCRADKWQEFRVPRKTPGVDIDIESV